MSARILVVDDNQSNLDLMLYLLKAFGYDALATKDGYAGWEAAQREHFDLILTDILMPKMDGYELARRVATLPSPPPIVAVTALAMTGDRDKMIGAGFNAYLPKPIDPAAFKEQVERFLRKDGNNGDHPRC